MRDVDFETLMDSWRVTVGAEADLNSLPDDVSYKPASVGDADPLGGLQGEAAFQTLDEVQRQGLGVFQRAIQTRLGREVALKTLNEDKAGLLGFVAEARLHGRLEHPNIVPVYDLGVEGEVPWLAMKLVQGRSWDETLPDGKPAGNELPEHVEILCQVAWALAFAHSRQVVHNDVKPANVLLGPFGEVLLVGWDLAVDCGAERQAGIRHREDLVDPCGTPCYMPPELARGEGARVSPLTDVYLLGAVLFRLVEGRPPHQGASLDEVLRAAARGDLPARAADWPSELWQVCRQALAAEPSQRHLSAAAFRAALRGWLTHRESLGVSDRASARLAVLRQAVRQHPREHEAHYRGLSETLADFSQAIRLWEGNAAAADGARQAHCAWAELALAQGDFGLAEAQLAEADGPEADALRGRLAAAQAGRARARLLRRRLLWAAVAMGLLLLITAGGLLVRKRAGWQALLREREAALARHRDAVPCDLAARREVWTALCADLATRAGGRTVADLDESDRALTVAALDEMAAWIAWAEELVALSIRPLAGASHPFLAPAARSELRAQITACRALAERLATLSGAFAMARLLARDARTPHDSTTVRLDAIDRAENELIGRSVQLAESALVDLREGPERSARPTWMPTLDEWIEECSGLREPAVAACLVAALEPSIARASASEPPISWTQAEAHVVLFCLRVLGNLRLSGPSSAVLRRGMTAFKDPQMLAACATALCNVDGYAAAEPLAELQRCRLGQETSAWHQVEHALWRMPLQEPHEAEGWRQRAWIRSLRGEADGALADALRARALGCSEVELRTLRGHAQRQIPDFEAACQTYQQQLAADGQDLVAQQGLASSLAGRGLHAEALALFETVVQEEPRNGLAHWERALCLRQLGRDDEALAALAQANLWALTAEACRLQADIWLERGQHTQAIAACRQALLLAPASPSLLFKRGVARARFGTLPEALADFSSALAVDAGFAAARAERAARWLVDGVLASARDDLKFLLAGEPAHSDLAADIEAWGPLADLGGSRADRALFAALASAVLYLRGERGAPLATLSAAHLLQHALDALTLARAQGSLPRERLEQVRAFDAIADPAWQAAFERLLAQP